MVSKSVLNFLKSFLLDIRKKDPRYLAAWLRPIDDLTGRSRYRLYVRANAGSDETIVMSHEFINEIYPFLVGEPYAYISSIHLVSRDNLLAQEHEDVPVLEPEGELV